MPISQSTDDSDDYSTGTSHRSGRAVLVAVVILALAAPTTASAYVGPGAGLTVIGAALAFIASVLLAAVGLVWYPLKRLLRAIAAGRAGRAGTHPASD